MIVRCASWACRYKVDKRRPMCATFFKHAEAEFWKRSQGWKLGDNESLLGARAPPACAAPARLCCEPPLTHCRTARLVKVSSAAGSSGFRSAPSRSRAR